MEPETEQTTLTDGGQGRSEAGNSGDSDLNSLLQEYEEGTTKAAPAQPAPAPTTVKPDLSELKPIIDFVEQQKTQKTQETFNQDVDKAVDTLAGQESLEALPKDLVRDMLVAHAFNNADFDKAFQNRADNPAAWDTALKGAEGVLAEKVKGLTVQQQESNDRGDIEAAVATVQDVTDPTAEDLDEGPTVAQKIGMSDTQWRDYLAEKEATT